MFRLSVNGSWPLQSFSNFADVTLAVEQLSLHVDISMPWMDIHQLHYGFKPEATS